MDGDRRWWLDRAALKCLAVRRDGESSDAPLAVRRLHRTSCERAKPPTKNGAERPQITEPDGGRAAPVGAFVRAADYINATRVRLKMTNAFHALFSDIDVVVTASSLDPACRIDDREANDRTYGRQARAPFNVTGSPALSVPVGFSKAGLPLGMQIVGKPFSEALIYRVAHAYEQATQWVEQHPPLGD